MLSGEQIAHGRAQMASSGEVGDRCTAINQVLRSLAMNTPVDHGRDLVTDAATTLHVPDCVTVLLTYHPFYKFMLC